MKNNLIIDAFAGGGELWVFERGEPAAGAQAGYEWRADQVCVIRESRNMRGNLKKARIERGLTQQKVADYLHTDVRYYKQIESGERLGSIKVWDALEDLFSIHQRKLRELSEIHPGKVNNQ